MRLGVTAAALLAVLLCGSASGRRLLQDDTTGVTKGGYTFGSNIAGYLLVSQDVCDIIKAVDASNLAEAQEIYTNGRNSKRSDGMPRTLKSWSTADNAGEPVWDLFTAYFGNDSAWVDTYVSAAFNGEGDFANEGAQKQAIKKGIQANLQAVYMLHELDAAAEKVKAGNTDAATGAPHNVDEAAAMYFGTCSSGNLADMGNKRATTFGTLKTGSDNTCTAEANIKAAEAFTAMRDAAGSGDAAAFEKAYDELIKVLMVTYTQATLTYGKKLDEAVLKGEPDVAEEQTEGLAFFRTIAPLVAAVDAEAAETVTTSLMQPSADTYEDMYSAFKKVLESEGIALAQLGTQGASSQCSL